MPLTSDQLLAFLAENGIPAATRTHEPVRTVAESQALRGDMPGAHTKNLFLRDSKKTYFLVTLDEDTAVDLKALGPRIGARGRLSFASPETLYEHLGILPGAVSVLAVVNDADHHVRLVVEDRLLDAALVNCHPLVNTRTSALAPADLLRFLALTGHAPQRIAVPGAAASGD